MFDWKQIANWVKILIVIEMAVLFVVLPDKSVWDIIFICIAQYAVFAPIDASLIIKNIKGAVDAPKGP